jgi:hypothetical protein
LETDAPDPTECPRPLCPDERSFTVTGNTFARVKGPPVAPRHIQDRQHVEGRPGRRAAHGRPLHLGPEGLIVAPVDHHKVVVEEQAGHVELSAVHRLPLERKARFCEGTVRNDDRFVEPVVEINDLVLVQQLMGHRQGGAADKQSHHTVRVSKVLNVIRVENRGIGKRLDGPPLRTLFEIFRIEARGVRVLSAAAPSLVATHQEQRDHHEKQLYPGMSGGSSNHCAPTGHVRSMRRQCLTNVVHLRLRRTVTERCYTRADLQLTHQTCERRFITKGRLPPEGQPA